MKLAAISLLLLLGVGCRKERADQVIPLDDEIVATYIRVYSIVGPAYREAYEAGTSPSVIPQDEKIRAALRSAGWTWTHYQRVHGSIGNALLHIEHPEMFRRLELTAADAPPGNVEVVRRNYFEIKKARLIGENETYGGRRPPSSDEGTPP